MSEVNANTNEVADETTGLTLRDIEELREWHAAATPGEWFDPQTLGAVLARHPNVKTKGYGDGAFVGESMTQNNRRFVVEAHNKFERLLDVAEKYLKLRQITEDELRLMEHAGG